MCELQLTKNLFSCILVLYVVAYFLIRYFLLQVSTTPHMSHYIHLNVIGELGAFKSRNSFAPPCSFFWKKIIPSGERERTNERNLHMNEWKPFLLPQDFFCFRFSESVIKFFCWRAITPWFRRDCFQAPFQALLQRSSIYWSLSQQFVYNNLVDIQANRNDDIIMFVCLVFMEIL